MSVLEHKFKEFGEVLERTASSNNKLEGYINIDSLITQINKRVKETVSKGFPENIETLLSNFKAKYKGLLEALGIQICTSRKLVYRKKKRWKKKGSFHSHQRKDNFSQKRKVYCEDCQQFHFV